MAPTELFKRDPLSKLAGVSRAVRTELQEFRRAAAGGLPWLRCGKKGLLLRRPAWYKPDMKSCAAPARISCKFRPLQRVFRRLGAACFLVACAACLPNPAAISPLYDRLAGRGPVLIEGANPTLPASAFYAEQVQASPALSQYVSSHGEPIAISVERKLYRATRLGFYYPQRGQVVTFTRWGTDWQAEPATQISSEDSGSLSAQLAQSGRDLPAAGERTVAAAASVKPAGMNGEGLGEGELRGRLKPPGVAGEAKLARLPNGDYEHRVAFQGETLQLLAEWYTEDPGNANALAAASGKRAANPLQQGEKVRIPRRLMRNVQPLPEAAVP